MIPTIMILATMLGHHADQATQDVAEGIDQVCDNVDCQLDAIATCWIETRCTHQEVCGPNGCGPFQQVRRYTDIPELEGLTYAQKTILLETDMLVAAKQWKSKRDKYKRSHGRSWPIRYNGTKQAKAYYRRWQKARLWAYNVQKQQRRRNLEVHQLNDDFFGYWLTPDAKIAIRHSYEDANGVQAQPDARITMHARTMPN